jgi:FkbM family methyltransferase
VAESARPSFDDLIGRWSENSRARNALVPFLRAYIRYFPLRLGKPFVWTRIVEPYLAWQPHPFRARTSFGFHLEGDSQDLIQQWVYYFGVWEPSLTTFVRRRLRLGDTCVDVGANIGYYALLASKQVGPSGRVVAIEASPAIYRSLERNVGSNPAANVRMVNAAAYGRRAVVRLYRGNAHNCGETTMLVQDAGTFECDVDAFPLQDLLTPTELQSARLIKIDTEGAEHAILSGFESFDRLRSDAEFVVEVHPSYLERRGESLDAVLRVMETAGFAAYVLDEEFWGPGFLRGDRPYRAPSRLDGAVDDGTVLIFSRVHAAALE